MNLFRYLKTVIFKGVFMMLFFRNRFTFKSSAILVVIFFTFVALIADEDFATLVSRLKSEKQKFSERQQEMLTLRYDLSDRPVKGATMSRGKPIQEGVRVKLADGMTWESLSNLSSHEIKEKKLWPAGFLPLPHPHHEAGGMIFPKFLIEDLKKQTDRDLTRFDLDFDLPDHFLPEFPAAIYLTTRLDLGDVSQGKQVTISNFNELFKDILNPKQLEGLRLLVTPFPQQQFNATADRRSLKAHLGVSCFDCHSNGHTNAATHTVGDIRPNEFRHRIDTPTLRGVNVQHIFGSQRAIKTIEDFTEFEQRAAYFDGIPSDAVLKGANILDRGSQVQSMAEFQELLDFPPAPKLDLFGKLIPAKSNESELRGQEVFFGKGKCASCHIPPYYTDNLMHNLKSERFFKEIMVNGRKASIDGPIKTFPLRGIKDSPPYLHDNRLLTLEDTAEFFNLILEAKLTEIEKKDLVAFLRAL